MKRLLVAASVSAFVALLAAGICLLVAQHREIERLAAKAAVRDQVCGLARSALYVDRTQLAASPAALDGVLRRVNTVDLGVPYSWGDNAYFVSWCASAAFPQAAWDRCRAAKDAACLQDVLHQVEETIE